MSSIRLAVSRLVVSMGLFGAVACGTPSESMSQAQKSSSMPSTQSDSTCGVVSRMQSGTFQIRTVGSNAVVEVLPQDGATANSLTSASRKRSLICIDASVEQGAVSLISVAFLRVTPSVEVCGQILASARQDREDAGLFDLSAGGQTFIELSAQDGATRNILEGAVESGDQLCITADFDSDTLPVPVKSAAFIRPAKK